ncbi:MAG TPA: cytochrome c biogenesis protein ResB [bacterium]
MLRRAWEQAHSIKLALALMLLCALFSVPGTLVPADRAEQFYRETFGAGFPAFARAVGLLDGYRSPPFVAVVALLAVNVALCTWRRFRARSAHAARLGWVLTCSDLVLHLSLICVMAGGVGKALWGFVGTQYLFVGVETSSAYDPRTKADVPLGFTLLARERTEEFYPLQLRMGIRDAAGSKVALLELAEGRPARLPDGSLTVSVQGLDAGSGTVRLTVEHDGRRDAAELVLREGAPPVSLGAYRGSVVAYRRELKSVGVRVAVLEGGREVKQGWLRMNGRLAHRGTSVFLTGWGRDEFGSEYVGVQVSRDPAAPLFWIGCTLFGASTLALFASRSLKGRRA